MSLTREDFLNRLWQLATSVSSIKSGSFIPGTHKPLMRTGGTAVVDIIPFREGVDRAQDYAMRISRKLGRPMKKVKSDEKENLCVCLLDSRPSLALGAMRSKREFALEVAALIGLAALKLEDRALIWAMGLGDREKPSGTNNKSLFLYKTLELFDTPPVRADAEGLALAVEMHAGILPRNSSVFIISDCIFSPDKKHSSQPLYEQQAYRRMHIALESLAIRRDVGVIVIQDVRDVSVPSGARRVKAGPGAASMVADDSARHMRTKLVAERKQWLNELEGIGIDYCVLETTHTDSHIPELLDYLAARS